MTTPIPIDTPRSSKLAATINGDELGRRHNEELIRAKLKSLVPVVLAQLPSPHSRRVYGNYLTRFLNSKCALTREGIIEHLESRKIKSKSGSVKRMTISALRHLLREADSLGLVNERDYRLIREMRCDSSVRQRSGTWLTLESARELINAPARDTTSGKRDAAIFALLLGCGLRREEACNLTWQQFQTRDGRAVLIDIEGKGARVRSVPVPEWARQDLEAWKLEMLRVLACTEADVMRLNALCRVIKRVAVLSGGQNREAVSRRVVTITLGERLSSHGVWYVVDRAAKKLGIKIRPHDLRRTLAKLMRKRGVAIEQIQFQLGHANLKTTELYLGGGIEMEVGKAGVDQTGMGD